MFIIPVHIPQYNPFLSLYFSRYFSCFAACLLPVTTVYLQLILITPYFLPYSRHGFTVGPGTLGRTHHACSNLLRDTKRPTCPTASPIACYAPTGAQTRRSKKIYRRGLEYPKTGDRQAVQGQYFRTCDRTNERATRSYCYV
jgi:hypothetical protein